MDSINPGSRYFDVTRKKKKGDAVAPVIDLTTSLKAKSSAVRSGRVNLSPFRIGPKV